MLGRVTRARTPLGHLETSPRGEGGQGSQEPWGEAGHVPMSPHLCVPLRVGSDAGTPETVCVCVRARRLGGRKVREGRGRS